MANGANARIMGNRQSTPTIVVYNHRELEGLWKHKEDVAGGVRRYRGVGVNKT